MPVSYTTQEAFLAFVVALLASNEIRGILAARAERRSRNLTRLLSHVLMLFLLGPWIGYTFYWTSVMDSPGVTIHTFGSSALNLPYLLLGVALMLIATWEILSLYRAREAGFTNNTSRLLSHALILVLVAIMVSLSLLKWNQFASSTGVEVSSAITSKIDQGRS